MQKKTLILVIVISLLGFLFLINKENKQKEYLESEIPSQKTKKPESFSIVLSEYNNSGQSGLATIETKNDVVVVKIRMVGTDQDISEQAHIHKGSCVGLEKEIFKIAPVINGVSDTNIIARWDEFIS